MCKILPVAKESDFFLTNNFIALSMIPLGRIGDSDEAASAVLFLASAEAKFITGQILTIDGGRTLTENIGVPAY